MLSGAAGGRFCTPSTSGGPFRIFAVNGFQNRTNDIVYCPPILRQPSQNEDDSTAVIYFGGDVQDFPESMETNRDSRGYMKYNLESSAVLLRNAFPRSHIVVVRPARMEFKTFSCFDNFVRGNNAGVPDHTPMNHALQHLEKLLQNLSVRLKQIPESEILAQAAAAAAVAAATSASLTTLNSNNSGITPNINNQDQTTDIIQQQQQQQIDIDVLQVQETVTVNTDGSMIFPCNETTISLHQQQQQHHQQQQHEQHTAQQHQPQEQQQQTTQHTTITNTLTGQTTNLATELIHNDLHYNNSDCHNLINNRNPLWWRENLNLDKSKLILIGFSKGCVVLNQFIYEFHYLKTLTPDDSTMIRLLSRIKDMYWLDGGHGGQKNTWITSRSLLETLTRLSIRIHVHVTPYQVQDDRRPWIRKEEKIFSDMLRRLNADITRHLHFDSSIANLVTHFEVLQAFCQHVHLTNQQHHQEQLQQQQQQRMTGNMIENCNTSLINEEK